MRCGVTPAFDDIARASGFGRKRDALRREHDSAEEDFRVSAAIETHPRNEIARVSRKARLARDVRGPLKNLDNTAGENLQSA